MCNLYTRLASDEAIFFAARILIVYSTHKCGCKDEMRQLFILAVKGSQYYRSIICRDESRMDREGSSIFISLNEQGITNRFDSGETDPNGGIHISCHTIMRLLFSREALGTEV